MIMLEASIIQICGGVNVSRSRSMEIQLGSHYYYTENQTSHVDLYSSIPFYTR